MKFVCERCHTKYSIADDKVRQKILKIRCKTCENVITIRDAVVVHEPRAANEPPRGARVAPPVPPPRPAKVVEWHVAIDGRQEGPFPLPALVTRLQAVARTSEAYVWNDQLDGWKEPRSVPEVAAELRVRSGSSLPGVPAAPPPLPPGAGRRVPSPAGGRPAVGGAGSGSPLGANARRSAPQATVDLGARSLSPSGSAAAATAAVIEGEQTQIQAVDASLMMDDLDDQATAAKPVGAMASLVGTGALPAQAPPPAAVTPGVADRLPGLHPGRSGALPKTHGSTHGSTNGSTGPASSSANGLEALDFVPGAAPRPNPALGTVASAVAGASTATLLAQAGGRVSKPRHPAFKFVVTGSLLLGLVVVVAVLALSDRDRATAVGKPALAEATPAGTTPDPEARARAEAEKVFKSMVGERTPPPPPPVVAKVGPSPRRAPTRPRHQEPSLAPPPLAPPPLAAAGPQPAPDGVGVARRFALDERKVAAPGRSGATKRGDGSFDHQKFMGVFKQQDHHTAIKSCYERALKRDERLKLARLDISVNVGETGSVKKVKVDAPPEFNGVSSCIREAVRRWRFPANSEEYEASFPLILHGNAE